MAASKLLEREKEKVLAELIRELGTDAFVPDPPGSCMLEPTPKWDLFFTALLTKHAALRLQVGDAAD